MRMFQPSDYHHISKSGLLLTTLSSLLQRMDLLFETCHVLSIEHLQKLQYEYPAVFSLNVSGSWVRTPITTDRELFTLKSYMLRASIAQADNVLRSVEDCLSECHRIIHGEENV